MGKKFDSSRLISKAKQQIKNSDQFIRENITIDPELKAFIRSLSAEEFSQLEENLLKEGVRDPLIIWKKNDRYVLVDGHNRFNIASKHKLKFQFIVKEFADINEVFDFMISTQLGRRNLSKEEVSYYRGLRYENEKQKGFRQNVGNASTAQKLAAEYNTSSRSIERDAQFAKGMKSLGAMFRNSILAGKTKVKKADIQLLGTLSDSSIKNIKSVEELEKVLKNASKKASEQKTEIKKIEAEIIANLKSAVKAKSQKDIQAIKKKLDRLSSLF